MMGKPSIIFSDAKIQQNAVIKPLSNKIFSANQHFSSARTQKGLFLCAFS